MSSTRSSTTPASALPRHLDPRKFAQQGVDICGEVDLKLLERLCPLLANNQGRVSVELQFAVGDQGVRNVTGQIHAELAMICQRCLESANQCLDLSIRLGMVWDDEQASGLSKVWDPWILGEGQTDIYQMIEDELILGLPIVAYHSTDCLPHDLYQATDGAEDSQGKAQGSLEEKPNPFQVLEGLKSTLEKTPDSKPD